MLNGKEIVERGIVTNVPEENIAQHGVDLNLIEVQELRGVGFIPAPIDQKTRLPIYHTVTPINGIWQLTHGIYNITFSQGCDIPNDTMLLIRQRSSLLRIGGTLHSSVFDAGFRTTNIGTMMVIHHPLEIQVGARIAQIYNHICTPVENLYQGQWQQDSQRNTNSLK